jgi:hypothetical protein
MYLTLPTSMIVPDALERLEDPNFEDWLTAALIETASQAPSEQLGADGSHNLTAGIGSLDVRDRGAQRQNLDWQISGGT